MLLIRNLNALDFQRPASPGAIDLRGVYWTIFASMALYAALARPDPSTEPARRTPYARWVLGTIVALMLMIGLAGLVNGARTMASANTRWPAWAWTQGPFPGRR